MSPKRASLIELIAAKSARKSLARRAHAPSPWSGLGMFGIVGWSVCVPTVAGAILGAWLDRHYPGGRSLTLVLLIAGLMAGCGTAAHWLSAQSAGIGGDGDANDE